MSIKLNLNEYFSKIYTSGFSNVSWNFALKKRFEYLKHSTILLHSIFSNSIDLTIA